MLAIIGRFIIIYLALIVVQGVGRMPKVKTTKRVAAVKRMIHKNDSRLKEQQERNAEQSVIEAAPRNVPQAPSSMFMSYNTSLGPPFHILLDTNFINFSVKCVLEVLFAPRHDRADSHVFRGTVGTS
jgi:hypothetical protein